MNLKYYLDKFHEQRGLKRYLSNTSWLLAEKIIRIFANLLVGTWVARYLGPDEFGIMSFSQSFVALFMCLSVLGLDGIIVKDLVEKPETEKKVLGTTFILKLLGALATILIISLYLNFSNNEFIVKIYIFIIACSTIFQSLNVIDFYYQSKVLSKYVALSNSVSLVLASFFKIVLISVDAPLLYFVIVLLIESLFVGIMLIYFYNIKNKKSLFLWKFDRELALSLLKSSWPLMLSGLSVNIYMKIDQVMIREILGNEVNGIYAAAVKLSEATYFIPMVICTSLFPAILNAKKRNLNEYYDRLKNLYGFMIWSAIGLSIFVCYSSGFIIHLLFGDHYQESADIFAIHIWASIFVFLGVASGKWFVAEGLYKSIFFRNLGGCLLNIVFNFILIPQYGGKGAAIATIIAWSFNSVFYDFFDPRARKIFMLKIKAFYFFKGKFK